MQREYKVVQKRFNELIKQADAIAKTKLSGGGTGMYDPPFECVDKNLYIKWITSTLSLIQNVFPENSPHYTNLIEYHTQYLKRPAMVSRVTFESCQFTLLAAKEDYEGGYLFNMRSLVKAEAADDVLEQAESFLEVGYVDTACIMAGVALEITVKELCTQNEISHGSFNKMNDDLKKAGIYPKPAWRNLSAWYDRRNEPAHGQFGNTTAKEAQLTIQGIREFISTYL